MNNFWTYLTTPIQRPDIIWPYFAIIAALIVASIVTFFVIEKRKLPRFQKHFIRKVADFMLYMPTLFLLVVLAVYAGVDSLSLPVLALSLGAIWLIWFIFLVYYRLVVVKEFWKLYYKQKKEEKYINGKSKN